MATITKTKARSPSCLPQVPQFSWSRSADREPEFHVDLYTDSTAGGSARRMTLNLSEGEAISFAAYIARQRAAAEAFASNKPYHEQPRLSDPQALRNLADWLETGKGIR